MPNKLIEKIRAYLEKIRAYLKNNDLDKLKDDYIDMATDDDFINYEPLPQSVIDDSNKNKEKLLKEIADRNGF
tara:strand:- start:544 stop:762 length:219 start_codon:yes stop_codon:yes gene_type:complete